MLLFVYELHSVLVYGRPAVPREVCRVQRTDRRAGGKVQNGRDALQKIVGDVRAPWIAAERSPAQFAPVSVLRPDGHIDLAYRHDPVPVSETIIRK